MVFALLYARTAVGIVFVLLHILTAAAWFGLGLRLAGQARQALHLEPSAGLALARDAGRSVKLMGIFIVLTLVFALGAFFAGGGFADLPPQYHTSMLLIVLMIGVHYGLLRPSWKKLEEGLAASTPAAELNGPRKRVAMSVGISHLTWLILLVLMFVQYFGL